MDRFDPQRIRSQLVCGVLEAVSYEDGVLIERLDGWDIKHSTGKTRSALLISDSEVGNSIDMLIGVRSLDPIRALEVFKKGVFPYLVRGNVKYESRTRVNVEQRIELGEETNLVSLIQPMLAKKQHERHDIFTVDLSH